jgi:2-methylisocitrate lyase-like PEP mutase family enzyme
MTDPDPQPDAALAARRARFRRLHEAGCFVIPNPWDLGSLRRLEKLGFQALASTSAGVAWALGRDDGELSRQEVLDHLSLLCSSTDLPVNADFEAGFADEPEGVADSVRLCVATGVAGLSIEDRVGTELYDLPLAVERMRAARAAIDATGQDVLLVGRTEGYILGRRELGPTLERLTAYAEAGADCLYAPFVTDLDEIRQIVRAVAPRPVNVLMAGPGLTVADLAEAGVRRISIGAALAGHAWAGFDRAARLLAEKGRLPARG